jgi:hypothetical protein
MTSSSIPWFQRPTARWHQVLSSEDVPWDDYEQYREAGESNGVKGPIQDSIKRVPACHHAMARDSRSTRGADDWGPLLIQPLHISSLVYHVYIEVSMSEGQKERALGVCTECGQPTPVRIWPDETIHPIGGNGRCCGRQSYRIVETDSPVESATDE